MGSQLEQQEQRKDMQVQTGQQKVDAAKTAETHLKQEILRKKEELKQHALDLEELTRKERKMKENVEEGDKKTADIRRTIADVKAKADASARTVAAHKADIQKLQKAQSKLK